MKPLLGQMVRSYSAPNPTDRAIGAGSFVAIVEITNTTTIWVVDEWGQMVPLSRWIVSVVGSLPDDWTLTNLKYGITS